LPGLAVNAALGWWWLDACAGLAVGAVAVNQGRGTWREVAAADPERPGTALTWVIRYV
jgi:divalent metal cation (Fe/Co/Zn/Cd) transporter